MEVKRLVLRRTWIF